MKLPTLFSLSELVKLIPLRKADAHKYDCGRVLVISGASRYIGSSILSALAAYRSGAGWVCIAGQNNDPINIQYPEIILNQYKNESDLDQILIDSKPNVIVLGPGFMGSECSLASIFMYAKKNQVKLVLDAGFLRSEYLLNVKGFKPDSVVLTPHEGEAARLLGHPIHNRIESIQELYKQYSQVWVLKGLDTLIRSSDGFIKNTTGGAMLATAGTGDVLSGIIAAWIAQGLSVFNASVLGVYLHGKSGEIQAEIQTDYSVIASDIIDGIPMAIQDLLEHEL